MSAALNSGGTQLALLAAISDGTGATETVAAAATPQVIADTLFTQRFNNTAGGLVWDPATGRATVTAPHGVGKYLVQLSAGNSIGVLSVWHEILLMAVQGGAAAAEVDCGRARKLEPGTAAQGGIPGTVMGIVDLSAVGDYVSPFVAVQTNGNAVVFRELNLVLTKIGN
jgi:hypothetical protein